MALDRVACDGWVRRTLGVDIPAGGRAAANPAPVLPAWRSIKDRLDAQIGALTSSVRAENHPMASFLADTGIHGFTGRLMVPLGARVMDFDRSTGEARAQAGTKLLQALAQIEKAAERNPVIRMLDDNPFGVEVSIRGFLQSLRQEMASRVPT